MAHRNRPSPPGSSRDRHARAAAPSEASWLAPSSTSHPQSPLPTLPHRAQPHRRDTSPRRDSTSWPSSRRAHRGDTFSTGAASSTGATTGSSYQGSNSGSGGNNEKKTETGTGTGGGSSSTASGSGSGSGSGTGSRLTVDNLARTSGFYQGMRQEEDAAGGAGQGAEQSRRAWVAARVDYDGRRASGDGA